MKYYVLVVNGGCNISQSKAFTTLDERDAQARIDHAESDPETDTVFWADVGPNNTLTVGEYSGAFFEEQ